MNNEPAFPNIGFNSNLNGGGIGMTLRDYFAAKAMQVIMHEDGSQRPRHYVAKDAYQMADEMMKACESTKASDKKGE